MCFSQLKNSQDPDVKITVCKKPNGEINHHYMTCDYILRADY